MSPLQFEIEVSARSPEQRHASKIRLLQLAAQRPGQTGDTARATLGELHRIEQAAKVAAVVSAAVEVKPVATSVTKPATASARHDFIDDKSIASGHDERGGEGCYEEKW